VVLKWFYSLSRRKTFVGGKCALPSALLVDNTMFTISKTLVTSILMYPEASVIFGNKVQLTGAKAKYKDVQHNAASRTAGSCVWH